MKIESKPHYVAMRKWLAHAEQPALFLAILILLVVVGAAPVLSAGQFTRYSDPLNRFTFDYPSTMKVISKNNDEVRIIHDQATLRISVYLQQRPKKTVPSAESFLEAFKKNLSEEMKAVSIQEQGKLSNIPGSQAYIVFSYKDQRGIQFVQLVQYYVTQDRILQMTILDRPEGYKNLEAVIRKIHQSLKINSSELK